MRPIDPTVSNFPLPMSAKRARFEARNARRLHLALPKGHAYRLLPLWIPYRLAQALETWRSRTPTTDKRPVLAHQTYLLTHDGPDTRNEPAQAESLLAATTESAAVEGSGRPAATIVTALLPPRSIPPGPPFLQSLSARSEGWTAREVPCEGIGPGVSLRLRVADLRILREEFGEEYFTNAATRCDRLDIAFIARIYQLGGQFDGERRAIDIDELDHLPFAMIGAWALDALYVAVFGEPFRARAHLVRLDERPDRRRSQIAPSELHHR